jgi:hypothetical protein
MRVGTYRLNTPTIAVLQKEGIHVAHVVPAGALLTVEEGTLFEGNKLVEVTWNGKKVLMFPQDLKARCVPEDDA